MYYNVCILHRVCLTVLLLFLLIKSTFSRRSNDIQISRFICTYGFTKWANRLSSPILTTTNTKKSTNVTKIESARNNEMKRVKGPPHSFRSSPHSQNGRNKKKGVSVLHHANTIRMMHKEIVNFNGNFSYTKMERLPAPSHHWCQVYGVCVCVAVSAIAPGVVDSRMYHFFTSYRSSTKITTSQITLKEITLPYYHPG